VKRGREKHNPHWSGVGHGTGGHLNQKKPEFNLEKREKKVLGDKGKKENYAARGTPTVLSGRPADRGTGK